MNSFLYRVAETYYQQYHTGITRFTFVFPNRRAGLFFRRYLSEMIDKPLFSPEILTINDCFYAASDLQIADRLSSLFRLYNIYLQHSKTQETFDDFVFWGEMLLSDFDDVDRYLADAKQVFSNVTDLKEIDILFNDFTENQLKAIRQFWNNFEPTATNKSQDDFLTTWKILFPVYEQFRNELLLENTATEGMIFRNVAERLKAKETIDYLRNKEFVFVGFNALNPCEKTLMSELQKRGNTDFYWDYESIPLQDSDNPASRYFAENSHVFPSKFDLRNENDHFLEKEIELIAVPSSVGQAKQLYAILQKLYPEQNDEKSWIKTAVVLPDENLLIPLLHSLPAQIEKINVTMGFPLNATPVSGLIDHIFELQRRKRVSGNNSSFYHQNVTDILHHQYIELICPEAVNTISKQMIASNLIYVDATLLQKNELLKAIFTPQNQAFEYPDYLLKILRTLLSSWLKASDETHDYKLECDFIYQYFVTINRLNDLLKNQLVKVEMSPETLMGLVKQLCAGISIPFIGEPLDGLQVMGVLETRGLDFENLIISSFNEGVFPKRSHANSFIPYNLRKGFGLPTYEQQDAITSYNFYRLIHRAKRIFLTYDSRTDGMQTGEVSRYIHQLEYHYGIKIRKIALDYNISFKNNEPISIVKTPAVMQKLSQFTSTTEDAKSLSASSLNTYINCRLQFYLTRVESIDEPDEVTETIENNTFGTIFHAVLENIYKPFNGQIVNSSDLDELIKNKFNIEKEIRRAFAKEFFKRKTDDNITLEGNLLLISNVIQKYVIKLLNSDKTRTPFKYIESEKHCHIRFPFSNGEVNIKGFIDRVDEKNGNIHIIDYKTGAGSLEFKDLDDAFNAEMEKRPKYVLQTFLYGLLYKQYAEGKTMIPGIYYIRDLFGKEFDFYLHQKPEKNIKIAVDDFGVYEEEFSEKLRHCIDEIFDPTIPFSQTKIEKNCEYCQYKSICNR